ncbi:MAG TPA: type 1 glutamine amidotransferase [Acidimicrobiales bacterium]|nr:type 1 glutamine amidotransferase [Acidimicrobiales bacterium]
MANCLVVQHATPESPWAISDGLARAGVVVDVRRTFAGDIVPIHPTGYDGVVVMGGPMSAGSDEGYPSRRAELSLIAGALRTGIPTLGVCLGAQLLAMAAGARVHAGAQGPEIGWGPVSLSGACRDDPLFRRLPGKLTVLHWHSETCDLPEGAQLLMSNDRYPHQAFRVGETAWGVQCHLEVTAEAVEGFLAAFTDQAATVAGGPDAIRRDMPAALDALQWSRDLIFDRFAELIVARSTAKDAVKVRPGFP